MERYNYIDQLKADVLDYIVWNHVRPADYKDRYDLEEYLNDELFCEDSVTGNASGSYFCNRWKAEEALAHNLEILREACSEFGCTIDVLSSPEAADVTIRCYLLGQAISEVLDFEFNDEDYGKSTADEDE